MTIKISIPLSEVNEEFIRELKEKYPSHTRLDIQVVNLDEIPSFSEEDFWKVIDLLDWSSVAQGGESVLMPAVKALSRHPVSHIYLFEDMLADKLFQLDTRAHADAAYQQGPFSEDGFLYIRAGVVANGKERFEDVLKTPSHIDPEEDFEPLLSLAAMAYEQKTRTPFDYIPPVDYETYSNEQGWA